MKKTLMLNISELAQLSSSTSLNRGDILIAKKDMGEKRIFKACAEALKKDMFKSVIFDRLFEMLHYWTSKEILQKSKLL